MRIAHVREGTGPAGAPWRLAVAAPAGDHWLDLEPARRRLVAADPRRAHNSILFRQPITTLDEVFARGIRIEALGEILEGFTAGGGLDEGDDVVQAASNLAFGPPVLRPPSFRDFYAFEQHVATMWGRRGGEIPEAWFRLPIFYFSNTSELRGPGDPVWAPRGSVELDFELEVGAVVDTAAYNLARGARRRGNRRVSDRERLVRAGPAARRDPRSGSAPQRARTSRSTIGPWIVTPDALADRWPAGATAPDLEMTATVTGRRRPDHRGLPAARGRWLATRSGQMLARASADVHIRPGEILGSGTVGTGCLLEVKDSTATDGGSSPAMSSPSASSASASSRPR